VIEHDGLVLISAWIADSLRMLGSSTARQVIENTESTLRQYALRETFRRLSIEILVQKYVPIYTPL
jgi:hypothetical protein